MSAMINAGFQLFKQVLVDLDADKQRAQVAAGFGQAGAQALHPAALGLGGGGRWRCQDHIPESGMGRRDDG
ncbi:hypothetical protein ACU4GD_45975 [Cupriavidus basilensis]